MHSVTVRSVMLVALLLLGSAPAGTSASSPGETYVCWAATTHGGPGSAQRVVRCRIDGVVVRDFTGSPPVLLVPAVGTDDSGGCWYRRSWWSGWTIVARYPDGSARLNYDPDGVPGGPVLADAVLPACTSEPTQDPPDIELVWRALGSMRLGLEGARLTPRRPITGLTTYLSVPVMTTKTAVVVSPVTAHRITVVAEPRHVSVDWGDGSAVEERDARDAQLAADYPLTALQHLYETAGDTEVVIRLAWEVRWRIDARPWVTIEIEPLEIEMPTSIDEIVGRLTSRLGN